MRILFCLALLAACGQPPKPKPKPECEVVSEQWHGKVKTVIMECADDE